MKKTEYHKCDKDKGFCPALEMFTQPAAEGQPKGLSFYAAFDMNMLDQKQVPLEKAASVIGVVYRRKTGDKGVILNYCPFCGEDLEPFRKKHTVQPAAQKRRTA